MTETTKTGIVRAIITKMEPPYDYDLIYAKVQEALFNCSPKERERLKIYRADIRHFVKFALEKTREGRKNYKPPTEAHSTKEPQPMNQTTLLREILKDLQPPYDATRVMLLFNARKNKLPKHVKDAVNTPTLKNLKLYLNPGYVRQFIFKNKEAPVLQQTTTPTPSVNGRPPVAEAPPPDTYSQKDLEAARTFLAVCGDSIARANKLLKLVSNLIAPEE